MKNIMPPIDTPDNTFHDGNPATGEKGTLVPGRWLTDVQGAIRNTQQELISVLTEAGIEINESVDNQLLLAILNLIKNRSPELPVASLVLKGITQLSNSITSSSETLSATSKAVKTVNDTALKIDSNLSEIAAAGPAAIAATLANLTLKGASLRDVGTGANQIPDMNSFGVSFGASGYQKFPGGLILQWGRVTTTAALIGAQWNFPIPFPNEVLSYFAMTENSSGDSKYSNIGPISAASRTGATVSSTYSGAASNSCWALGR